LFLLPVELLTLVKLTALFLLQLSLLGRQDRRDLKALRVREFLYVARPEAQDAGRTSVVAVLSLDGKLLKEFEVPGVGPDVTSILLSPDGKDLLVAEGSTNTIVSVTL
jgi:sugar lactone lactonase YvrE